MNEDLALIFVNYIFLEVMLLPTCITALALHVQVFVHKI